MRLKKWAVAGALGAGVVMLWGEAAWAQATEISAEDVQANLDNVFVLVAAVLVIFMQAGFALVEAGLTRAKSVANIMMKNLMDFCAGALAFFAVGYAIAFGSDVSGVVGSSGWFLGDGAFQYGTLTVPVTFIFQVAFAATAATIVSGAMAERTKFRSYFFYSIVISGLIYPIVVHWNWGGGWLSTLSTPFHDFAGSTMVHMTGGVAALMGAMVLGPRLGKYGSDGRPRAIPAHNIPYAVLGTFILLVGWYGFNPGSELAADGAIGGIAVTTTLAAAAGAIAAMIAIWMKSGKPDVAMAANGMLAGLVGITAGTAAVSSIGAIVIGAAAGFIVVAAVLFFDRIRIDDPVGAISVHGVCGAFGTICVGLFATEDSDFWKAGLFYGGGTDQLVSQVIGVAAVGVFVAVTAGLLFLAIKSTVGLRVSQEEELAGLDVFEHGAPGYGPDVTPVLAPTPITDSRATATVPTGASS
ncbi:MAG: ammonium transporter [Actinobacteria bacterium]|nr:ammonium transporter [Actinomycetota bacterium]MBW3649317.1 ammonium transporter [Actinomycetota bacterium]